LTDSPLFLRGRLPLSGKRITQEQRLIFDALDELGGEPLDGLGFETEQYGLEFDGTDEPSEAASSN
jgi:hypothetical protein